MHSLVFDPCPLFADGDDSADSDDAQFRRQIDYRLGTSALTGVSALGW